LSQLAQPSRRGDGHADLSYVYDAAREIAAALDGFTVVITKSTVPVGTGDEVDRIIRETRPDANFVVVSDPEFLREGAAIHDFKHPNRIVVGTEDEHAKKVVAEIYRSLSLNQAPILYTIRRTAELIKYAPNAFLATKITFINEIADLCEKVGAKSKKSRAASVSITALAQVPACWSGLRWLLLSQGRACANQDRVRITRFPCASSRPWPR
jgi:UDPglucose 6-dehydrogenase